jgi:Putative Flp pilus-assembly TadE/G-like
VRRRDRRRDERGQSSVLIIGFAGLLAMVIALVVDTSAAYLQRQGLDTLADGAALRGADLGATGEDVYQGGVPEDTLALSPSRARQAVGAYLSSSGAYASYPGLAYTVRVQGDRVEVHLTAPLDLPLSIPGSPERAIIGADGSAVVGVDR